MRMRGGGRRRRAGGEGGEGGCGELGGFLVVMRISSLAVGGAFYIVGSGVGFQ